MKRRLCARTGAALLVLCVNTLPVTVVAENEVLADWGVDPADIAYTTLIASDTCAIESKLASVAYHDARTMLSNIPPLPFIPDDATLEYLLARMSKDELLMMIYNINSGASNASETTAEAYATHVQEACEFTTLSLEGCMIGCSFTDYHVVEPTQNDR
jgi:hypothetical protein